MKARSLLLLTAAVAAACAPDAKSDAASSSCTVAHPPAALPEGLQETSGLAVGRRDPGVLWTHNDSGGDPLLFAVLPSGELARRVRVEGAENRDWEDIASGPCPAGDCLFIGDIGDNAGERDHIQIYVVPEPDRGSERTEPAQRLRARYPGGARDAEALFVLPSGEIFIVSKGRREPVELFRYPLPLRPGETVELERVIALGAAARDEVLQVTGADASADGEQVAIRSYRSMMLYRTEALLRGETDSAVVVDLTPVGEPQGEAVALGPNGTVLLTSEGGMGNAPGTISTLACELP